MSRRVTMLPAKIVLFLPTRSERQPNNTNQDGPAKAPAPTASSAAVFHALWTGKEEQRSIHGRIPDDSEPCGQTEERHKQPTLISWISKTFFQWIGRSFARFLHCLENRTLAEFQPHVERHHKQQIGRAHV